MVGYPGWFSTKTGFQFHNPDGNLVVVLGYGSWHDIEHCEIIKRGFDSKNETRIGTTFNLVINPGTMVGTYIYKTEWRFIDLLHQKKDFWDKSRPLDTSGEAIEGETYDQQVM